MKAFTVLATLALFFTSHPSHATTWNEKDVFYTYANFSSEAFGKKVASVYIHEGVLRNPRTCGQGGNEYWENTQHVAMSAVDDHFFAKTKIQAATVECQPMIEGVVIQYWVYFTDGTEMKTNTALIPVTRAGAYSSEQQFTLGTQAFDAKFNQTHDASQTQAIQVTYSYAD